jgi:hypothetical protein
VKRLPVDLLSGKFGLDGVCCGVDNVFGEQDNFLLKVNNVPRTRQRLSESKQHIRRTKQRFPESKQHTAD